jgi:hypothetical protein
MLPCPPQPGAPITAVCAATYYADLIPAFAFVFRVESTGTRFTVYAREQDRWLINGTYTLTLSEQSQVPLCLSGDEAGFLRHCLGLVAERWQEAVTEAEAGAGRPPNNDAHNGPASPGHLNVEPTPAGYRTIAERFREELHRVQALVRRLDQPQPTPTPDTRTDTETDTATDMETDMATGGDGDAS